MQIVLLDVGDIGQRILEQAITHQHPSAYDMSYVALAERLQTVLVTADERLLSAVGSHLPFVQPLWEYRTTTRAVGTTRSLLPGLAHATVPKTAGRRPRSDPWHFPVANFRIMSYTWK